ncbi:Esrp1 [Scenedesmus sp. PABB004]|nr:Esrp1 [Scenedesmus sp. PABB004]
MSACDPIEGSLAPSDGPALDKPPAGPRAAVLRMRGLPFSAGADDVKAFFDPFTLDEVYICRRDGRATGEAYAVLASADDAQAALAKLHKQYMGSRYIELFEAAEADLAAVKKVLEDSRLQGFVVRLRGLPFSASAADVVAFFSGVPLAGGDDAVVFVRSADGRPTGECYVEVADEASLAAAMARHKELMGTRYIEIFNSSKVDKLQALQQARFHAAPRRPGVLGVPYGAPHHMLGVPGGAYASAVTSPDQLADALMRSAHISPPAYHMADPGGGAAYQVLPARGMVVGPDGQPAQYYYAPQGAVWPQPRVQQQQLVPTSAPVGGVGSPTGMLLGGSPAVRPGLGGPGWQAEQMMMQQQAAYAAGRAALQGGGYGYVTSPGGLPYGPGGA